MAKSVLPESVNVISFVEKRLEEIKAVSAALETKRGGKRMFQTLPRNLRRRAMSYNAKRIPRHLRELHQAELDKQGRKSPAKRPSRKYRRRPRELLEEYNRRKRVHVWLETHIWHAKRFKMKTEWGYKIPLHLNTKSQRTDYRAVTKGCAVQDISYYNCVELQGDQKLLLEGLGKLTDPSCGSTFNSLNVIKGDREGRTFLYSMDKFPYNAIGPVTFLWKPLAVSETNQRSRIFQNRHLWIWFHPSMHEDVIGELTKLFSFKIDLEESGMNAAKRIKLESSDIKEKKKQKKNAGTLMRSSGVSVYSSKSLNITMIDLKDTLIRFKLFGPRSSSILGSVLRSSSSSQMQQEKIWEQIFTNDLLTELPPHFILGLTVKDPRTFFPNKKLTPSVIQQKKDSETSDTSYKNLFELSEGLSTSLLWNQKTRDEVTYIKLPDMEINQLRRERLTPDTPIDLGDNESTIPVILIYNPGNRQTNDCPLNFGAGWDVILPAGWAMPFWISLIYNGAHPAGMQLSRMVTSNQMIPFFPYDFPDTFAGKRSNEQDEKELMEKDLKRPPAKRINYNVLKVVSPYSFPWKTLITDFKGIVKCDDKTDDYFVLRNVKNLKKLDNILKRKVPVTEWDIPLSLICVRLELISKGNIGRFAMICIPNQEDLEAFNAKQFSTIDETSNSVSKSSQSQKQLFRTYRQKRKKIRAKIKTTQDSDKIAELERKILKLTPEMKLPNYSKCENVVNSCSRIIIGFVTNSHYGLSVGHVHAVGYCVSYGLEQINNGDVNNVVLLRSTSSNHYYFAKLSIILPI